MTEFAVCDAQVTLLKLLDGYLHNPQVEGTPPPPHLVSFLITILVTLSTNLRDLARPRDSRDAATFQAVVLVLLSLCSIGQGSDRGRSEVVGAIDEVSRTCVDVAIRLPVDRAAEPFASVVSDLLRYSDELSKPRSGITELEPDTDPRSPVDIPAVEQLKRTCVRLCAIAAFEQKDAQDVIRESGALVAILGMCQINDANPSKSGLPIFVHFDSLADSRVPALREHAMFAVRNILQNNETNQVLM